MAALPPHCRTACFVSTVWHVVQVLALATVLVLAVLALVGVAVDVFTTTEGDY